MTFKYVKTKKKDKLSSIRTQPVGVIINEYTGEIDGKKAAHGEENFLKEAYKTGKVAWHEFRVPIGAPLGKPGQKELDFLLALTNGEMIAIQIRDYDFIHKGFQNEGEDVGTDMFILKELKKDGTIVRGDAIQTISDDDVDTPELARKVAEELLM